MLTYRLQTMSLISLDLAREGSNQSSMQAGSIEIAGQAVNGERKIPWTLGINIQRHS